MWLRLDRAFFHGEEVVARLVLARLAAVDEEGGPCHRGAVELAHGRQAGSDRVHVRTGLQPLAAHDRVGRGRHGADDVCVPERLLRGLDGDGERPLGGESLGALGAPGRDLDLLELAGLQHRRDVWMRLVPGADHRQHARVLARQGTCGDAGDRGCSDRGDRGRVDHGDHVPVHTVVQRDRALVRVEAAGGVLRDDGDRLQAVERPLAAAKGRHHAEKVLFAGRLDDRPERQVELAVRQPDERLLHRLHAPRHVEEPLDLLGVQDQHPKNEPTSSRSAGESASDNASWTFSRCSGRRGPTTTDPARPSAQASASAAVLTPRAAAASARAARSRRGPARCRGGGTAPAAWSSASRPAALRPAGTSRSASRRRAG